MVDFPAVTKEPQGVAEQTAQNWKEGTELIVAIDISFDGSYR